jgi:hypothetical protein
MVPFGVMLPNVAKARSRLVKSQCRIADVFAKNFAYVNTTLFLIDDALVKKAKSLEINISLV